MKLLSFFTKINTPFDGEITRLDTFESRNAIEISVRFDSDIDIENQKKTLEEEIAKSYKLSEVTIKEYHQLKPQEVLDKILYSDDFEATLLELLELKDQKAYKIGMSDCELDIDIFNIEIDSETFKAMKKKKSELRFNLHHANILNIEEKEVD